MRNRICYNCGFVEYYKGFKGLICPVCNASLTEAGIIDHIKLEKMPTREQSVQWIEKRIGHPIPEELNILREEYLRNRRLEGEKRRREEQSARIAAIISGGNNRVTCSYCNSTNVSKISVLSRTASTEIWGLGSDKIGKQFHCNNCGANF